MSSPSVTTGPAPPSHHQAVDSSLGLEDPSSSLSASASPMPRALKSAPLGAQLDAALLDDYLTSLLVSKFTASLEPLFSTAIIPTVKLWIRPLLTAITLWATQAQTPATQALGLQQFSVRHDKSRRQALLRYVVIVVLLPLVYQHLQRWIMEKERPPPIPPIEEERGMQEEDEEQIRQRLARQRKFQVARRIVQAVDTTLPIIQLGLLLSYLVPRKYSDATHNTNISSPSPHLAMRLAGFRYTRAPLASSGTNSVPTAAVAATVAPQLFVLYAHRRWLYEQVFSTLHLVLSPLADEAPSVIQQGIGSVTESIRRPLALLWRHVMHAAINTNDEGDSSSELEKSNKCALCHAHPIRVPYEADACCHVFCYACLWNATAASPTRIPSNRQNLNGSHHQEGQELGTGFPCPVCRALIRSCRPLSLQR